MHDTGEDLRVKTADDPSSLLVAVLDTNISSWVQLTGKTPSSGVADAVSALQSVAEQLLVFLNMFLLLHEQNRVCVIIAGSEGSRVVYPTFPDAALVDPAVDDVAAEDAAFDGKYASRGGANVGADPEAQGKELRDAVADGIRSSVHAQEQAACFGQPNDISTALALALCLLNRSRVIREAHAVGQISAAGGSSPLDVSSGSSTARMAQGRIFALLAGKDTPEQYVPIMNCIFSAQRIGVPIDTCLLGREFDSTFFQQAAYLTRGAYLKPEGFNMSEPHSLMQYLMTVFLTDRQSRDFLVMPSQGQVDFRASCFETRKVIEDGYTCSVCLSTFDTSVGKGAAMCSICGARFAVSTTSRRGRRPPRP